MSRTIVATLLIASAFVGLGCGSPDVQSTQTTAPVAAATAPGAAAVLARRTDVCPAAPTHVVEIRDDTASWRNRFVEALSCPNTLVQLGPDIDMSFADYEGTFPITVNKCVSVVSVASFSRPVGANEVPPAFSCGRPETPGGGSNGGIILRGGGAGAPAGNPQPPGSSVAAGRGRGRFPALNDLVANFDDLTVAPEREPGSARSPRSLGPRIFHGARTDAPRYFFRVDCKDVAEPADGVRFSGFRLEGPSQDHQTIDQSAITIDACVAVEISNMEISGWGANAIAINDVFDAEELKATLKDGGRITRNEDVVVADNYLHNNQHPSNDGHAAGYGVDLGEGAWAQIVNNVFDQNRHSIAATGNTGGYLAQRNLVLRGGGYHGVTLNNYTHQVDVHGTDHCTAWYYGIGSLAAALVVAGLFAINPILGAVGAVVFVIAQIVYFVTDKTHIYNCGLGGIEFNILDNAVQYDNGPAIKFRGTPRRVANVQRNVFPHGTLYKDGFSFSDAAVQGPSPLNIVVTSDNVKDVNTYGEYAVCDFDGDAIDDLFLATGASWWYSSYGEFQWSYMNAKTDRLSNLKFGYIDNDRRCDVIAEFGGQWHYVSGGYGNWTALGAFDTPLKDVALGRFDVSKPDMQAGATRQTTHAFRRASNGQWETTTLLGGAKWSSSYMVQGPNGPEMKQLQNSGKPLDQLNFGDFTGDGVTDVLSVDGGRWHISKSALEPWQRLNPTLGEGVGKLVVANMDADNIDDVLKMSIEDGGWSKVKVTWWRSQNGTGPWVSFATYTFPEDGAGNIRGFAGRFGAALGGATLVVDPERYGRFHGITDVTADWRSLFPY